MNRFAIRWVVRVFLWAAIGVVGVYLILTLLEPVLFGREYERRRAAVIERMEDIRTAQRAYCEQHGRYAPDFAELARFIKSGNIPVVRVVYAKGDTTFSQFLYDTIRRVAVRDSLFPGRKGGFADSLQFVPYSIGVRFSMEVDEVESGRVRVPVLEVSVANKDFLIDQDATLYDTEGGLSMGSLLEPTLNGNWE
jgi:hypothetical protein